MHRFVVIQGYFKILKQAHEYIEAGDFWKFNFCDIFMSDKRHYAQ